jgi:glycosyltransferase involved in cell wall biosynthesis
VSGDRRVLFVSYAFPPVGGVGVLRVSKFVKYLPEFGWCSSVLTVSNPSVPLFDESLLSQIPQSTLVRKARTWEPGYQFKQSVAGADGTGGGGTNSGLTTVPERRRGPGWAGRVRQLLKRGAMAVLQPDPQILWYRNAVREGRKLLREVPHAAIVASGPPFTDLLVGAALARSSGVPLILDYRDEWEISNAYWENRRVSGAAARVQRQMQNWAVRRAVRLVATTPLSAAALQRVSDQAGSRAIASCIYNGYDPSDFAADEPPSGREDFGHGRARFRLSFAGTLWELTSIAPFVEGCRLLCERAPELAGRLELVFAGRRAGEQDAHLDRLSALPCRTVRLGYLEHARALRLMATSDELLLLLSDVPHADRVISSKMFEYMAARRPIFAVTPSGDQEDVLATHPAATIVRPGDPAAIAEGLAARLRLHAAGHRTDPGDWDFSRFERRHLTGQLAAVLDGVSGPERETGTTVRPPSPGVASSSSAPSEFRSAPRPTAPLPAGALESRPTSGVDA